MVNFFQLPFNCFSSFYSFKYFAIINVDSRERTAKIKMLRTTDKKVNNIKELQHFQYIKHKSVKLKFTLKETRK